MINVNYGWPQGNRSGMIEVPEERWEQFEENIKNYFKFELFNISNKSDK